MARKLAGVKTFQERQDSFLPENRLSLLNEQLLLESAMRDAPGLSRRNALALVREQQQARDTQDRAKLLGPDEAAGVLRARNQQPPAVSEFANNVGVLESVGGRRRKLSRFQKARVAGLAALSAGAGVLTKSAGQQAKREGKRFSQNLF